MEKIEVKGLFGNKNHVVYADTSIKLPRRMTWADIRHLHNMFGVKFYDELGSLDYFLKCK